MGEDRRQIDEKRADGLNYDVFEAPEGISEVFADGYHKIWMNPSTARFGLYIQKGTGNGSDGTTNVEDREAFMRITMPTVNLVEFCHEVIKGVDRNREQFKDHYNVHLKKLLELVDDVKKDESQTNGG